MTDANQNETTAPSMDELMNTQGHVAEAALRSESCWDILEKLHLAAGEKAQLTQGFIGPVLLRQDELAEHLNNPESFMASFQTTMKDVKEFLDRIGNLKHRWVGLSGTPTDEQYMMINEVTQEYSRLLDVFENTTETMIYTLLGTLKQEYPQILELDTTPQA